MGRRELANAFAGVLPSLSAISSCEPLYLAIVILGATVMPHKLYLHSSVVQTRVVAQNEAAQREAIGLVRIDTVASLPAALAINAAILVLAAAAFHGSGSAVGINEAWHLLDPVYCLESPWCFMPSRT